MEMEHAEYDDPLRAALEAWGQTIDDSQMSRLREHFLAMVEANRTMNLTRITDPVEAAIKHYADSLALLLWEGASPRPGLRVLDVGTGAGFPALPLAVMRPQWAVTAIDGTAKKIDFLRRTAAALGLTNLHAEHAHADHWETRQRFDCVVARALGRLDRVLTTAAKHLAPKGTLVIYKTADLDAEEAAAGNRAALGLGLKTIGTVQYQLVIGAENFHRRLHLIVRSK